MKFNKDSLISFFVNHTEKVILGFFVLGFLLMVWGGFSLKPLSITPSQLESSIAQGKQKLESSKADDSQYVSVDYEKEAGLLAKNVSPDALSLLKMNNTFRHAIAQPKIKRTQPPVLCLTDLKVSTGVGFCSQFRNETGGPSRTGQNSGKTEKLNPGVRWVVVTALIPNLEQQKKFNETFENADVKYPESDVPTYYSFYVEREEITSSGSKGWEPLDVKEYVNINAQYSGNSDNDIVSQEFRSEKSSPVTLNSSLVAQAKSLPIPVAMAMKLMNLTNHQWGEDCAHSPEIPVAVEAPRNEEPAEEDVYNTEYTAAHEIEQTNVQKVPYKLFRFFDTKVEGGKKYRYRFRLVLKNPNYNVKTEYVESEDMTVNPFIEGDWCKPSPIAEVPFDTRLYCVGSRAERAPAEAPKLEDYAGPSGQLMILKFDEVKGLEIIKRLSKEDSLPGMILNFYNTGFSSLSDDAYRDAGVASFVTNDVVLDYSNKTKQPGVLNKGLPMPPTRALLMSRDGKVFVLSEDKDKSTVFMNSKKPVLDTSAPSNYGKGGQINDDRGGRPTPKQKNRPAPGDHGGDGIFEH